MPDVVVAPDRHLRRHPARGRALRRHRAPRRHRPLQGARVCRSSLRTRRVVDDAYVLVREAASLADLPDRRAGDRAARAVARERATRCARAATSACGSRRPTIPPSLADDVARAAGDRRRLPDVHRRPRLFDRAPAARSLRLSRRAARDRRRAARPALLPARRSASTRSRCATAATRRLRSRACATSPTATRSRSARTPWFRRRAAQRGRSGAR